MRVSEVLQDMDRDEQVLICPNSELPTDNCIMSVARALDKYKDKPVRCVEMESFIGGEPPILHVFVVEGEK